MGHGNLFPGDHKEKQAARLFLYRFARAAPIRGQAVTLAGSDPDSEVNLMRHYLKWPGHRVWFVDHSREVTVLNALERIKRSWPEANVKNQTLTGVIPNLQIIGFANLDFMGFPLQKNALECLQQVIPRMLPKAILGFTWIRGREVFSLHKSARLLWKLGKGFQGNERRWAGVTKAIDQLSGGTLKPVGRLEYFSNHSPMSVSVFQKE